MAFRGTTMRLKAEDELLHKAFGDEWEAYREKVIWSLIPGVF